MGLLFGKKKKENLAQQPPIRKSRAGSTPKRVGETGGAPGPTNPYANNNTTGNTSGNTSNGKVGINAGLASNFKQVGDRTGAISGFSNTPATNTSANSSNMSTKPANPTTTTMPIGGTPDTYTPLERVINIYGVSLSLFNVTRAVTGAQEWNDPEFIQFLDMSLTSLQRELAVVMDGNRLKDWTHPLHHRKTGAVLGAAKRIAASYKEFNDLASKIKTGTTTIPDQRQIKETLKELQRAFLQFLLAVEMVVPADFFGEVNELARTLKDVVDTAIGKLNFVFDDVARICSTCSIKISRLALWKALQVENVAWTRAVNDTCFTISKAVKVMYAVGQKVYNNPADQGSQQNLTALTKGIVTQLKKLQTTTQTEPPSQKQVVVTFTPEVIKEHLDAYDQGIREVTNSLAIFTKNNSDLTVVGSINKIITQLEIIKNTVKMADNPSLVLAVASISDSLEKFCGAVYYVLHEVGEDNEVIKEQIMETMQHALHCAVHLQLVASTKSLQFTILNPEATMLTCLRSLLLSVSYIIDAVDYMKATKIITDDIAASITLGNAEIHAALVYILHYGRALFKGDEGDTEFEIPTREDGTPAFVPQSTPRNPATTTATTTTTTTTTNTVPQDSIKSPRDNTSKPNIPTATVTVITPSNPTATNTPATTSTTTTATITTTSGGVVSPRGGGVVSPRGGGGGGGGAGMSDDELLSINPDSYGVDNLPPGFDPAPARPVYKPGSSEEEYKMFMVAKYEYETWENKLILYKIKLKKQIEEAKSRKG